MVHELLKEGESNAQTGKQICDLLGISNREMREAISIERRAGFPICSSSGENPGYFLAANRREMETFCRSLKHRAGEIYATRKACLNTIDSLPEGNKL